MYSPLLHTTLEIQEVNNSRQAVKALKMKLWIRILCILMLVSVDSAFAYLDPGTGSMLLQVILGGVAAVGVALKLYWCTRSETVF